MSGGQIDTVMQEDRLFPPPAEFCREGADRLAAGLRGAVRAGQGRPGEVLGRPGQGGAALVQAVRQSAGVERAVRQMVRRRPDERLVQLPRRPSDDAAPQQGGAHLGRRAGRHSGRSPTSSCTARSASSPTCSKSLGLKQGRRGVDLHADDAGAGDRHAGLCPDRRGALASSSAAFPPRRSPTATTTPRPKPSSRPTAAGGAASSCR